MTRYVALLRAVNVGGGAVVRMAALRDAVASLGFSAVGSVLQSGNVTFTAPAASGASLEGRLESRCRARLGLATDVMVRTASAWEHLIHRNPFREAGERDPAHLVLGIPKSPVNAATWDRLASTLPPGRERVARVESGLYFVYPDGIGRSKLTSERIERALATRLTLRNWNTVARVAAQLRGAGS